MALEDHISSKKEKNETGTDEMKTIQDRLAKVEMELAAALMENADLEERSQMMTKELAQMEMRLHSVQAESGERLDIVKRIAAQLENELDEERRMLKEHSRLERTHDRNAAKVAMFERSRTGRMVEMAWKVWNKIRRS